MTTKQRYWNVHYAFFEQFARNVFAYGMNANVEDPYPWDEYIIDTLTLTYA